MEQYCPAGYTATDGGGSKYEVMKQLMDLFGDVQPGENWSIVPYYQRQIKEHPWNNIVQPDTLQLDGGANMK